MRLRNITGCREMIGESEFVVHEPETMKGKWREAFGNDQPVYVEIGMGKGRFLMDMARLYPEINFIGIEKYSSVLLRAVQKLEEEELPNVRLIRMDAEDLENVFAQGELDRIYLNFSDPWPPNRQRKRRLTWRAYLEVYDEILRQQGDLCFKTDNQRFFEWSLQEICQFGWLIQNISLDLHNSDFEGNVMTEYEEKFSAEGYRIYRLEARRRLPEFLKK